MPRLLILNWRDALHPRAGGAELVTLRIAERLVERGWEVEWFSASYPGSVDCRCHRGINFIHAGGQATVHLAARARYGRNSRFDVIVDEINTVPFYAHLYLSAPTVAFIHQLAREVWVYEKGRVLGGIGKFLEPMYLHPYRNHPIITISESSAASFREIGLEGPISVVPMAVDEEAEEVVPRKMAPPEIVIVSRITPSKRIEESIRAAAIMKSRGWAGNLTILGGGEPGYVSKVRKRAEDELGGNAIFTGYVSNELRREILRRASCIWMTSVREGWGLVVTEAARHGTPAVVYRIPGLINSVIDGCTGYVVDPSPLKLANATLDLLGTEFQRIASAALLDSQKFNWNRTTDEFESALFAAMGNRN